jgi:N-methylhydantoinase A/oxoprolinase/acetone carboxylase beta subunit
MDGRISIGPQRIVPISLIGSKFPEVRAMLEAELADQEGSSMHGKYAIRPFGAREEVSADGLSSREREILRVVSDRPLTIRKIAGSASAQRALTNLKKRGLVQICGFTPSDAAHVLDLQNNWSASCAWIAAELMVRHADMRAGTDSRVREFCQAVWSETVRRSARATLDLALGPIAGGEELLDAVCSGSEQLGLAHVKISPAVPVIAVGGPAKVYYGEVGRRLGCEIVHPPHFDVANAVGAATGVVSARVIVTVEGDGGGVFRVHGPAGTTIVSDVSQALAISAQLAREAAGHAVRHQGAEHFDIDVTTKKVLLPDAVDDNGLLSAEVTAEAVGRPFF